MPRRKEAFLAGMGFAIVVMLAGTGIWLVMDVDKDGRSSFQEIGDGTSPTDGDSDDDGIADGFDTKPTEKSPTLGGTQCTLGFLECEQEAPQQTPKGETPPAGGDGTVTTVVAGGALSIVAGVGARIVSTMILRK